MESHIHSELDEDKREGIPPSTTYHLDQDLAPKTERSPTCVYGGLVASFDVSSERSRNGSDHATTRFAHTAFPTAKTFPLGNTVQTSETRQKVTPVLSCLANRLTRELFSYLGEGSEFDLVIYSGPRVCSR